jgi:hypothetical protein
MEVAAVLHSVSPEPWHKNKDLLAFVFTFVMGHILKKSC